MKNFEYVEPQTVQEVKEMLCTYKESAKLLAGGTDLLIAMKQARVSPSILINLKTVNGLNYVEDKSEYLEIGATTPLSDIVKSPLLREKCSIISTAAVGIASYQIRNRGTLGGNLCSDTRCWYASQSSFWRKSYPDCRKSGGNTCYIFRKGDQCQALLSGDLVPALIAINAEVLVQGESGQDVLPLESMYTGDGYQPFKLKDNEFITGVRIHPSDWDHTSFVKFSKRRAVDFSLASVAIAVKLKEGSQEVKKCRIVLGAVSSSPLRSTAAESLLESSGILNVGTSDVAKATLDSIQLTSSSYAPVWYKLNIIESIVQQGINTIKQEIKEKEGK